MATIADADQLRRMAASLDQRAATLQTASRRLEDQVAVMVYAGPAASEFRAAMVEKRQQLQKAAADLGTASALLARSAFEIEAAGPAGAGPC